MLSQHAPRSGYCNDHATPSFDNPPYTARVIARTNHSLSMFALTSFALVRSIFHSILFISSNCRSTRSSPPLYDSVSTQLDNRSGCDSPLSRDQAGRRQAVHCPSRSGIVGFVSLSAQRRAGRSPRACNYGRPGSVRDHLVRVKYSSQQPVFIRSIHRLHRDRQSVYLRVWSSACMRSSRYLTDLAPTTDSTTVRTRRRPTDRPSTDHRGVHDRCGLAAWRLSVDRRFLDGRQSFPGRSRVIKICDTCRLLYGTIRDSVLAGSATARAIERRVLSVFQLRV